MSIRISSALLRSIDHACSPLLSTNISSACVQLCINDVSPSSTGFATLNALALSITSGVRAFAPALGTSIFAAGVRSGWAHGHLVFFVLFSIGVGLIVACNFLPPNAEGKPQKDPEPERDESEE